MAAATPPAPAPAPTAPAPAAQATARPAPTHAPKPPRPPSALLLAIDDLLGLHAATEMVLIGAQEKDAERLTPEDREALKHYEEGLQKILDLIAPSSVEVKGNEILLNDQVVRTLYVYNWPAYIYPNWLSQIVNFDAQMDIAQFIYPASNAAIMKMLRKKVAELRSSIRILEQRGIVRDPGLEAALQDAEELRDLLTRGREKLFQFGMYISLYADDEEKLKKIQTDIESVLGGKLVLTKPATLQMEHGWTSTLPLCIDELEITRNMNTSPLATSFPFSSSDLTDNHGILYGINRHNDSLVIFDRFDLPNANSNVFATSGAGKSFAVKLEILRSLMLGTEVLVIDPENEYGELCETVGGSFIPLSLQSDFRVNPFDLPRAIRGEEAQTGEVLRAAVINLHGLFKLMLGNLTPSEDGILDKAILDTYALKGITLQAENPGALEPPTLKDLVEVLQTTEGGENMANVLQKYTVGSYAGLFDRPTNVPLERQMIVFQIRDLEDQLRPIAIYVVLNFLWNRIRAEMKRRYLVIDEAWNLMQYEDSARFLYGIVKRARKYYLGITTITQDVDDFVNSPYGKPIITNSSLQVLLKQSATAIDNLQKLFYLTDGEKYVLLNSGVGQGIFFAGNKHVAIQIIASPEEATIITTKPEEVIARREAAGISKGTIAGKKSEGIPLSVLDGTAHDAKEHMEAVAEKQGIALPAAVPEAREPEAAAGPSEEELRQAAKVGALASGEDIAKQVEATGTDIAPSTPVGPPPAPAVTFPGDSNLEEGLKRLERVRDGKMPDEGEETAPMPPAMPAAAAVPASPATTPETTVDSEPVAELPAVEAPSPRVAPPAPEPPATEEFPTAAEPAFKPLPEPTTASSTLSTPPPAGETLDAVLEDVGAPSAENLENQGSTP